MQHGALWLCAAFDGGAGRFLNKLMLFRGRGLQQIPSLRYGMTIKNMSGVGVFCAG
jgi:hypothetical protein